jgi:hypothetical protein
LPVPAHDSVLLLLPTQSRPPLAGAGLVHDREYPITPCPHDTEHDELAVHSLHWPLIAAENMCVSLVATQQAIRLVQYLIKPLTSAIGRARA